jgi:uncharacterized membrane protein
MAYWLKLYCVALVLVLLMDLLWLGVLAKGLYQAELAPFLAKEVRWGAAALFYLLYAAGILFFAISPAVAQHSVQTAIVNGAFLGVLAYATYDLTNLATLEGWPLKIVWIDIAWGAFLSGTVAWVTFLCRRWA